MTTTMFSSDAPIVAPNQQTPIDDVAAAATTTTQEPIAPTNEPTVPVTMFEGSVQQVTEPKQKAQTTPLEGTVTDFSQFEAQYKGVAEKFGIELPSELNINQETYEDDLYSLVTEGVLKNKNPELYDIFKADISVEEYMSNAMHYKELLSLSDAELYARDMAMQAASTKNDAGDFKTQEELDSFMQEEYVKLLEEANSLPANALKKLTDPQRKALEDNVNNLPEKIKAAKQAKMLEYQQNQVTLNNKDVDGTVQKILEKKVKLPIQTSDAQLKDFADFYKKELTSSIDKNDIHIPFFNVLENDPNALLAVMQLYHLYKSGGISNIKNTVRESVISKQLPLTMPSVVSNPTVNNPVEFKTKADLDRYLAQQKK